MFSWKELTVIKDWAEAGISVLDGHLRNTLYSEDEKELKRQEQSTLYSVVDTVGIVQKMYIPLDADHLGHLLEVCKDYCDYILVQHARQCMTTADFATEKYMVGYMQGKLELGFVTATDLTVLHDWEEITCKLQD